MARILVTGANGLLARALVERLVARHEVHGTVHTQVVDPVEGVHYHRVDLAADDDYGQRLPAAIDVVAHLAQSSKYRQFPEMASDIFAVNTAATARLLDYARRAGATQLIYFSTGGLYRPSVAEIEEDGPLHPLDALNFHFASKLSGEAFVNCYAKLMKTAIVRPFFVWGRGQRRSMFMPRLADQIRNGEPVFLDGPRGIRVNPIHVEDAAAFVTQLIAGGTTGLFNMAGPEVVSIRDIGDAIGRSLGIEPAYTQRGDDPQDLVASIRRMRELHQPRIRFVDRVEDVLGR